MSLRTDLVAYLTEILAAAPGLEDVKVVGSVREVGELDRPVLIVKTNSYAKVPAAPIRNIVGEFTITLISAHRDIDRAENDLEDRLEVLTPLLFTHGMSWQAADQAAYDDQHLCFDIRITSIYRRAT